MESTRRAALITGGAGGIGVAIARMLVDEGYGVTIAGRRRARLDRTAEELRDAGGDVQAVRTDVAEEAEVIALAEAHRQRFGRLDVLVNSAGVGDGGAIGEQSTKRLDMQLAVNLRAVHLTTRECLPMLLAAGSEHGKALVANLSSLAGKAGGERLAAYSATKAGVVGFTQALAAEHARDGIQATAICPGFVDTSMTRWLRDTLPREEMIQPVDVAEAVRFLLQSSPACRVPELVMVRPEDPAP